MSFNIIYNADIHSKFFPVRNRKDKSAHKKPVRLGFTCFLSFSLLWKSIPFRF